MKILTKIFPVTRKRIPIIQDVPIPQPQICKPNVQWSAIKSQTAQALYSTDYVPKSEKLPNLVYKTFVFDKATKELVDVYVRYVPAKKSFDTEKFFFYTDKNFDNYIGERAFRIDNMRKLIDTGHMHSFDTRLAGIGIRGHQLAVEMMQKLRFSNIKIKSVMSAFNFHKKCGFEIINEYVPAADFEETLTYCADTFKVAKKQLRKLIVYSCDTDKSSEKIVNQTKTFENFTNYLISKNIELPFGCYMPMQLSKNALEEWQELANYQPILI